jgi:hypothetical protein
MCPTSTSPPGAVREKYCSYIVITIIPIVENMIKVTDCNELENLAEFYIFIWIWSTAPGGDEDIWAIKLYSGLMQLLFRF